MLLPVFWPPTLWKTLSIHQRSFIQTKKVFQFYSICRRFSQVGKCFFKHLLFHILAFFSLLGEKKLGAWCDINAYSLFSDLPFYILLLLSSDDWENFLERVASENLNFPHEINEEEVRNWASFRGQTLSRTGMLYQFHFINIMKLNFILYDCIWT